MPRVDADLKLDFKDVLFRPKRSSLKSRSEVGAAVHVMFRSRPPAANDSFVSARAPSHSLLLTGSALSGLCAGWRDRDINYVYAR